MEYFKRKLLPKILDFIDYKEAIIIYGARQMGKTTIMKMAMKNLQNKGISNDRLLYFDLEDIENLELFNRGIETIIQYIEARIPQNTLNKGKLFLFIDEIQYLKNASSVIKLFVDHHSDRYKLIVSGSSVLSIKTNMKQSIMGRAITFELFGLDFEEWLEFKNIKINPKKVIDSRTNEELSQLYKQFILYGCYPRIALIPEINQRKYYLKELIQTYIKKDIREIGKVRNILKFNNFLRVLADQTGNLLNIDEIASTIGMARETVYEYLALLEGTYIAKRVHPFFRNIRSELTKMPKLYFEDTGILNYLKYQDIVEKVSGELFENSIYNELKKCYGQEKIKYWRTQNRQEIDFVVQHKNKLLAFEVKKQYTGQKTSAQNYFSQKYPDSTNYLITLEKKKEANQSINLIYPWEIYKVFN
ncbi:MAG: AAA ATPase [Parcubacteria bacterium 33_209]|nr:MAG: AAA ATPase [Parcubacteria bacterium 33_209]